MNPPSGGASIAAQPSGSSEVASGSQEKDAQEEPPMQGEQQQQQQQELSEWREDGHCGPEWKNEFAAMLKRDGVAHRIKSPQDTNALAVVDRKIQQIKTAIPGRNMEEGEKIGRPSCLT